MDNDSGKKPRQFYLVDATDNSGWHVIDYMQRGFVPSVNTILVREVLDEPTPCANCERLEKEMYSETEFRALVQKRYNNLVLSSTLDAQIIANDIEEKANAIKQLQTKCELLEASKHIQTSGMETEIQRLQKQLEECLEVLKSIDGYKRYMLGVTVDKIDALVAKLVEK